MNELSLQEMRAYLGRSISSLNQNKLRGVLAEVSFREYLESMAFGQRVSAGGWLARSVGSNFFGQRTFVLFPETMIPGHDYSSGRNFAAPPNGLHAICSVFQQIGVEGHYCQPVLHTKHEPTSIEWHALRLGVPEAQVHVPLTAALSGLTSRAQRYNFLKYQTDTLPLPDIAVPEEFSKENLRVSFQSAFMTETSDIDGVFWGQQYTYPIEIKEKSAASDRRTGDYFGIDMGPFTKLAFYAARQGNLKSLFVVREIDHPQTRNLMGWWYITFEHLAQFASWVPQSGGMNMGGGGSTVVKIPKTAFSSLDKSELQKL